MQPARVVPDRVRRAPLEAMCVPLSNCKACRNTQTSANNHFPILCQTLLHVSMLYRGADMSLYICQLTQLHYPSQNTIPSAFYKLCW